MKTKVATIHNKDKSYLISTSNIVTDIGISFLELTGYSKEEIINKDISEVFTKLLRLHQKTFKQINIRDNIECYIFTKSLEAREVDISSIQGQDEKSEIYIIVEKPNSWIQKKFLYAEQLLLNNCSGIAIYSTDLILLKANQTYLDFLDKPYNEMENSIGLSLYETINGFKGSDSEALWLNIIKTGETLYVNENRVDRQDRGVTYWDSTIVPISEDGRIKYLIENSTDVTKRVFIRKHDEENTEFIRNQNKVLNRQATMLNLSKEAIFAWNLHGTIIYWNGGAEKKYGYSSEEAIGYISHVLLKTVHQCTFDDFKSKLIRDGFWNGEIEHTCKDGRKLIVETRQQVISDEFGQQIVLETNRDITERKKIEEDLKNSQNVNAEILESISDGFFSLNYEWRYTYVNRRTANNVGYEPKDLINRNIWEMFGELKDTLKDIFYKVMTDRKSIQIEFPGILSETYYQYNVYPTNGGISVYWMDISERKKTEESLERSKQKVNEILNSIQEDFYVLDYDWNFVYASMSFTSRIDKKPEDFIGKNIWKMFPKHIGTTYEENLRSTMDNRKIQRFDIDGKYTDLYYRMAVFPSKEGITILGSNITEQKKLEREIACQNDKMLQIEIEKNEYLKREIEMKDEFLSLISHEFKTPLTVINSAIQAMELICKSELSDKSKGFLNKIRQNSNRQLKLVNNLLDITRANAGHLKINKKDLDMVLLTRSITESITIFSEQKGIKLSFSTTLKKKVMGIDEEKYERILLNLLSNAVKFTPKGKSVTVKLSQKIVKGKCKVCIQVSDKGVGIPHDKRELIFERFGQVDSSLTRQAEGTGIGLSLVKMLVELLGGEITLDSKEGKGSTFTILLPIEKVKETPIEQMLVEINDNRLIQAMNIEFSDIY